MPRQHRVVKIDADRIYVDQVERLNRVAATHGLSKAELHRRCLDFALDHFEAGSFRPPQPEPDKAA